MINYKEEKLYDVLKNEYPVSSSLVVTFWLSTRKNLRGKDNRPLFLKQ